MTTPRVTEAPAPVVSVSRDPFIDDLTPSARRTELTASVAPDSEPQRRSNARR
jgi:hypothetical protein